MALPNTNTNLAIKRIRLWYGILLAIIAIFVLRLFYVQVIHYGHYKTAALNDQLKQYQIPATRGVIKAHDGETVLPIVLNQQLYTLYADPVYIKKPDEVAAKVSAIIGGDSSKYEKLLNAKDTRYVVLKRRVLKDQANRLTALKYPGLGLQGQDYRTYPQGTLLAQVLGFVNDEGKGTYGVEQALDKQLKGKAGQLKAITDVNGVPLAASKDNTQVQPTDGEDIVLTIDLAMQQQLETMLKKGLEQARAGTGSALIMDAHSGAIKAMASYPTYDPAQYNKVTDARVFNNGAVTDSIEVGSTMKPLTTAAALDQGVINANTTYYDPASWVVDGFKITNIEEDGGGGTKNLAELLNLSLNTGATWELMQMGGGKINNKARVAWHNYLVNHYLFGKPTGVEQGYEAEGYVPDPAENGAGINLTYANTTFGQAMTATPIQMAAALAAIVNGGTYYQPRLVDQTIDADGQAQTRASKVLKSHVVSKKTTQALIPLMQYTVAHHSFSPQFDQTNYTVGGKTGTAQIAKPGGGYFGDLFNGTYIGFVGGDRPDYVIAVFVDRPKIGGYAGSAAAQPIFGNLAHMLINNSYVAPKSR
jgi:cell division protein FtsI/penicillin-binding protein 2